MLNFIATFKGLYFHTFLHFTFHLPIFTTVQWIAQSRCIFL